MSFSITNMLPSEFDLWIQDDDQVMQDEELSATSHEDSTRVFAEWQTEDEPMEINEIMRVDEQIGTDFLDAAIFSDPAGCCISPVGPIEELVLTGFEDEELENIFLPVKSSSSLASSADSANSPEFNEQYQATLQKLAESMKRSHETRKSLTMITPKTEKYSRSTSVTGVVSSTEKSSEQLQAILQGIQAWASCLTKQAPTRIAMARSSSPTTSFILLTA